MIKCNVNVCGTINRAASVKKGKDGNYLSFGVIVPIIGRNDVQMDMEICVMLDVDKAKPSTLAEGKKVNLTGVLNLRKRGGTQFYYLRAASVEVAGKKDADRLEGTMTFIGKLGKNGVESRADKNGSTYLLFSAFSSDKDGEKREFTWVRFLYFNPKEDLDFLQPATYVQVEGDLQLGVYEDAITVDCRVSDVQPWTFDKH